MKKYISLFLTTVVFLAYSFGLSAQGIFVFDVISPVVGGGKITINNPNVATPISFDVVATTLHDLSTSGPFSSDMIVTLVYEKDGAIEEISNPIPIANNKFSTTFYRTDPLRFSGSLPANKIGGVIKLKYSCFDYVTSPTVRLTKYSGTGYQVVLYTPPAPDTPIDWSNPLNAKCVVVNTPGRDVFNTGATVARNGSYRLEFQPDGNLVLYNGTNPLWASGKKRGNNSTQVRFYDYGVGCYEGSTRYWWSGLPTNYIKAVWILQDDGNFVGYSSYKTDSNGVIFKADGASSIGATMTQGGIKSNRSGRLN